MKPVSVKPSGSASADAVPQSAVPRLSLGTTAASLHPCPQTGLWECAAELAAGEKRRFFPQGMALPQVIARAPERSVWQKMKGEPVNRLADTTWTLVGYGVPGEDSSKT